MASSSCSRWGAATARLHICAACLQRVIAHWYPWTRKVFLQIESLSEILLFWSYSAKQNLYHKARLVKSVDLFVSSAIESAPKHLSLISLKAVKWSGPGKCMDNLSQIWIHFLMPPRFENKLPRGASLILFCYSMSFCLNYFQMASIKPLGFRLWHLHDGHVSYICTS